jgi:hypothetical protein
MDNNSEFKLTTTNRNKKDSSVFKREDSTRRLANSKDALPKESRLLITEKDLPNSFNKLLSNALFSGDI